MCKDPPMSINWAIFTFGDIMAQNIYSYVPTKKQQSRGAERIEFTTYKPKYVIDSGTRYTPYYDIKIGDVVLENVTYNVGRHLMTEYRKGIQHLRTEEQITAFTEKFKKDWFTNETGRTATLFENLSMSRDGMLSVLSKGLQGKLDPRMQEKFDILAELLKDISGNVSDMNNFYLEMQGIFGDVSDKYKTYFQNSEDLTTDDIQELEKDIDSLIYMAGKYVHYQ